MKMIGFLMFFGAVSNSARGGLVRLFLPSFVAMLGHLGVGNASPDV